jgi:large subunit ribosomal protein L15
MADMTLHAPEGANKKKKIVGRGQGSGHGTTACRGNKGQQSRSGGKVYTGFEGGQMPLYRRLAHRGFSNHPFRVEWQIVNLGDVAERFSEGETVNLENLLLRGLVKKAGCPVKVLGKGEIGKKLSFDVKKVSKSAKAKIEAAGGSVAVTE